MKSYQSKMTNELHKRGACEILDESLGEMKRTLELTTERPLKKSDLKISVSLLRNFNNIYAQILSFKHLFS